jgi:hypothetical protein
LVAKIAERGRVPQRLLADTTAMTQAAMTQEDIITLAERYPNLTVYSPPAAERPDVTAEMLRKQRWKHRHEPPAVTAWGERMASEEGRRVYRRRKLTERVHGIIKNCGMTRFSGAWVRHSPRRLPVAGADPQPVLGRHAAPPYCRGSSNGDTGDRMTAAVRLRRSALRDQIHGITAQSDE